MEGAWLLSGANFLYVILEVYTVKRLCFMYYLGEILLPFSSPIWKAPLIFPSWKILRSPVLLSLLWSSLSELPLLLLSDFSMFLQLCMHIPVYSIKLCDIIDASLPNGLKLCKIRSWFIYL